MKCCLNQHGFKENQIMAMFFNNRNTDFFFHLRQKLSFSSHNEGFCQGAMGCAVSLWGRYMTGELVVQ